MKKAKSSAKRQASSAMSNELHCFLVMDDEHTISELSKPNQSRFFGLSGSIRNLMAVHNSLIDQAKGLSESNARAIFAAASVLESHIDQKIDSMNQFLDTSLDIIRENPKKRSANGGAKKKKTSKKSGKKIAKKNVKK